MANNVKQKALTLAIFRENIQNIKGGIMSITKALEELVATYENKGTLEKIQEDAICFMFTNLTMQSLQILLEDEEQLFKINAFCAKYRIPPIIFTRTHIPAIAFISQKVIIAASKNLKDELEQQKNNNGLDTIKADEKQLELCKDLYSNKEKWENFLKTVRTKQFFLLLEKEMNKFIRTDPEGKEIYKKVIESSNGHNDWNFITDFCSAVNKKMSELLFNFSKEKEKIGIKIHIQEIPREKEESLTFTNWHGETPQA